MTTYLDTSAAAKLLTVEVGTAQLGGYWTTSTMTPCPARCWRPVAPGGVAARCGAGPGVRAAARVTLIEPGRTLFHEAGLLPGPALRSLDALHLATALHCDDPVVVSYDRRILEAATALGMTVHSP